MAANITGDSAGIHDNLSREFSARRQGGIFGATRETALVELVGSRSQDRSAIEAFLRERNALQVARNGVLVDALDHPAVLAWSRDELRGIATYVIDGPSCELLTLHASTRAAGIGSALLAAVKEIATDRGCSRLWVVTTNDNLDALRFYQRRGFRLALVRPGAVDRSRDVLKPEIPRAGEYGIPLRDELQLEMTVPPRSGVKPHLSPRSLIT
jgi:GNAT superfamily N-acetyltransferase